jgi:hypothetical protein
VERRNGIVSLARLSVALCFHRLCSLVQPGECLEDSAAGLFNPGGFPAVCQAFALKISADGAWCWTAEFGAALNEPSWCETAMKHFQLDTKLLADDLERGGVDEFGGEIHRIEAALGGR